MIGLNILTKLQDFMVGFCPFIQCGKCKLDMIIIIIIMHLYSAQYLGLFNQSDCTRTAPTHK